MALPPLGQSKAAAGICSAAFLLMCVVLLRLMRFTKFRLYAIMGLAAAMRGIAQAIRAATISAGESNSGEQVVYNFFSAAGFGISIAIQCLVIACWFKNTHPVPPLAKASRIAVTLLFPLVIIFGPVLGLTNALLVIEDGSPDALQHAARLRKASTCGMLGIASLNWLVAVAATLWVARSDKGLKPHVLPHHKISVMCVTSSLLVWAAAVRVAGQFQHPEVVTREEEQYPLQVLPELLQLMIWCMVWQGPLMARVHLSTRFDAWWEETHPGGASSNENTTKSGAGGKIGNSVSSSDKGSAGMSGDGKTGEKDGHLAVVVADTRGQR